MTKIEAENVIKNYKDIDDETGKQYGYVIIAYEGTDSAGNHLFQCKADGEENDVVDYPVYAVTDEKQLIALPE